MRKFSKKYICIKQHDTKDCACACLATISKQYGFSVPISKIRQYSGTDNNGTSIYGIIKGAEAIGFSAKAMKASNNEDIFFNIPLPAIVNIITDYNSSHFVVVHEINKKQILIADPAKGILKLHPEEFYKIWTKSIIFMVPSTSFNKGDETQGLIKRFWYLLKPQKKLIINIFLSSLLVTVLGIIGSLYFKILIDTILPNNLLKSLNIVSIGIILIVLFESILGFFRSHLLVYLSQRIDIPLLLGYYNHVIKLPMNFLGTHKIGEIISRFNDATKIRDAMSSSTLTLMIDTLMTIVGAIILYNQSSKLFILTFLPSLLYLLLVFCFKSSIEKNNRILMESNSILTSYLIESLNGIETVKSFNGEDKVNFETETRFIRFIKNQFKFSFVANLQGSLQTAVKTLFGVIVLWLGIYLTLKGELSLGSLISFNALLAYFLGPIERIINLQPQLQSAIVAADRLGEILDLELEKVNEESKIVPSSLKGDIKLKNINFRYGSRQLVLENINIDIKNGEKIALVGESGSGKTTISKLLLNYYTAEKGEIFINNYNIKDISKDILRDKIAYISQDIFFFSGSIKDNLKFANENATYEDIIEACKNAQIHDYINSLPLRYDTNLEENASNLSGGQKQRLAIARALLRKPEVLIMDEATSNLDSITESAIENTMNKITKNITTIIIAHRLSTIMRCNKIYVMDKGQVIEYGNHKELIAKKGYYSELWSSQTSNSNDKIISKEIVSDDFSKKLDKNLGGELS